MDYNNFDNKENLGHGIKGEVDTDSKDSKSDKKSTNRPTNDKCSRNDNLDD